MYRYVDAALIRACAGRTLRELSWPDLDGTSSTDVRRWRSWLASVWARPELVEAVEVASPPLAAQVRCVLDGRTRKARSVRRTVVSLMGYALRMQHRATPFGVFAGIAPAAIGVAPAAGGPGGERARARADAVWLAEVVTRLEECPAVLRRLTVVADPSCRVRGQRLVVPCQQSPHESGTAPVEVSMRHTWAVQTVLASAQEPIAVGALAGKLGAEYPDTPASVIDGLLGELVARRVLLTSLRPAMTVPDGLGHVVRELAATGADTLTDVAPTVDLLTAIHQQMSAHNHAAMPDQRKIRAALSGRMRVITDMVEQPLAVDLRLGATPTVPRAVVREAERAVNVLARLSPHPSGSPSWQDYRGRFLERFGPGALVPVLELTDPDVGLGFPAGYRGSMLARPAAALAGRDEQLLALAQQAALDGAREVVLTEALLARLAPQRADRVPAHVEVSFHLHAPTRQAMERGGFTVEVTGLSVAAGTTTGRFLDLLDDADRDRMTRAYQGMPTLDAGAVKVQVSAPPLRASVENVSRSPVVLDEVLALSENNQAQTIALRDLAVGGDAHRLFLVSVATGQRVEPVVLNAVELTNFSHPLARFLCELPRAHTATVGPLSWSAAQRMPFLPRIRYGRAVLAPARWRLTAADLPGPATAWATWAEHFAAYRHRLRLPETVLLGDTDQRLRLDLDEAAHLQLLRAHLDRVGHATLREAPGPSGWFGDRAHEITLPLASTQPPAPASVRKPVTLVERYHDQIPGAGEWAYVKLYGHPDRHTDLLITHLPVLWQTWDEGPPTWWYVPYRDPDAHLRLRIRIPRPSAWGPTVRRVGTWAAHLRRLGLINRVQWDTYTPETGRYGTGAALTCAESFFAADSTAAVTQLASGHQDLPRPAVTAAAFVDLAYAFTGCAERGMNWLARNIAKTAGPAPDRQLLDRALRLADPHDGFAHLRTVPDGERITAAWRQRRSALDAYRNHLTAGQHNLDMILASLLHMHHIRAHGIDENCERLCRHLARSAAVSHNARGATP